jgi:Endonuclease-reverse transcriptase
MAYACKQAPNTQLEPPFTVLPWLDMSTHPCVQVLDIVFDTTTWHIINFYHDIHNTLSLRTLTSLDIDKLTPTLVMGDFNTHADMWSPPDVPRSRWANQIEEWAAQNLLILANNPGKVTH